MGPFPESGSFSGMMWDSNGGVGQSGVIRTTTRYNEGHGVSQWLNVNCLKAGAAIVVELMRAGKSPEDALKASLFETAGNA